MKIIVTKSWLKAKVEENPSLVIGRALVALFQRQTSEEKNSNGTKFKNGVGFSANDARIGTLAAKYYLKHGTLLEWQLKPWLKIVNDYPRITKYTKQLNEIANEKLNPERSKQMVIPSQQQNFKEFAAQRNVHN